MKAHRRYGIPTLMLAPGGSPNYYAKSPISQLQPRELPTSPAGRMFYIPGIPGDYDKAESLIRRKFVRDLAPQLSVFFEDVSDDDYETFKQAISPLAGLRSLAKNTQGRPEYRDKIASTVGSLSRLPEGFLPQFVDPLKQSLESELSRLSPRLGPPAPDFMDVQKALLESAKSSSEAAAEAARQEQEGLTGTATTPAETAPPPAGTAATSAATPTTPAGVGPADYGAGIVGVDAQTDAAAGYGPTGTKEAAVTPTTNPTVVTSIQSTISDIMGGEEAQFDEGKRLQELKDTFGLGISDMEKAAPGLAFAFSLMGAQRAPGESPFNALVRAAGSAGEAATKSNLALKQRERAIDSSLASTVLGEKKAAEQYARSKEWVAVWNGGFDENGVAQAEYLRMNADQIQKANEAGLQIVPLNVVSTATTAFAARSKAAAEAGNVLNQQIIKAYEPKSVQMTFSTNPTQTVDGRRLTGVDPTDGKVREVVIADDVSGQGRLVSNLLKDSATTLDLVNEMDSLINQTTGAINVASALSEKTMSLLGLGKNATAEDLYRAASEKGGVAFSNLSGFAKNKINVDNAYNELGADGVKRLLNIQGDFSEEDLKKRLSENINNVRGHKPIEKPGENASDEAKSAYQARVRFRAIQNALAAQLAPILLGESGRTISDADRVRVIALLGGFSDFSKAGVLTTAEEMRESTRMLREILSKYKDSALQDAVRMINSYDEASGYISPITKGAIYSPSKDDEEVISELRGSVQAFKRPNAGQAGQTSGVTTVKSSEL